MLTWSSVVALGLVVAQPDPSVGGLPLPPRLTSEVSDVLGLRTNPAGLGALLSSELRLLYGYQPAAVDPAGDGVQADLHSGGLYGAWKIADVLTLAGGYDFSERGRGASFERGLLGVGVDLGVVTWGLAWELSDDFGRGERGFVRLGVQSRPFRWAAFGVAVQDLAEAVGERSWDLGVSIRPGLDWLTVSSQWRLTEGVAIDGDSLDLRFLLGAEPVPGLVVGVGSDHDFDRLDFQLAVDFGLGGAEGAVAIRDDEPIGSGQLVARSDPAPSLARTRRVIVVDVEGDLTPDPRLDLSRFRFQTGVYGSMPLLLHLIARSDDARGAFLRIGGLDVGWAKLRELRRGIEAIRGAGKPVVCTVSVPSDREYYLASACDRVLGLPTTVLAVDGIAANLIFLGEGLSSLGVDVEATRRESYKTSPDLFTRREPSRQQEEVVSDVLDETFGTLVEGIAEGRRTDPARVRALIDRGTATATEALARGWLDATVHPDEVEGWIRGELGDVVFGRPDDVIQAERRRWGIRPKIAVIPIDAVIAPGDSRSIPFGFGASSGASTLRRALKKAADDPEIRAIVLRVDSPGGDALASALISRAVKKAAEKKPVIASCGDLATSGGYYAAAPAQRIFAERTSLVGGIGVFSLRVSLARLMSRLGIYASEYERGEHANRRSILQPLRKEDRRVEERQIAFLYDRFLRDVAEGRDMPLDQVRRVARGRTWTGASAQRRGLVDELGGLTDALRYARRAAGLSEGADAEIVILPDSRRPFPEFAQRWFGARDEAPDPGLAERAPASLRPLLAVLAALPAGSSLALPPTWVSVD